MPNFAKKHWLKLTFIAAVIIGAIVGYRQFFAPSSSPYLTSKVALGNITKTITASGEINATASAILKFQTLGKLAWIGVKEGDQVKKNQAIASLDKAILKKTLEKYLNDYMEKRWDFDQIRETNQVTTDNYDAYSFTNTIERLIEQEQFLMNKTVLDVEIQDLTNKLATLISPLNGIVTDIDTPIAGVNVTVTDAIDIVDPASLYFAVEIDETDIGLVREGLSAVIVLDAYENETLNSQVARVDFQATTSDSSGTVFLAKLFLPAAEALKYRLGLNGEATITVAEKTNVLVIPVDAVKKVDGKNLVQVMINRKPEDREVSLGIETDDQAEVTSGLSIGEIIVTGKK